GTIHFAVTRSPYVKRVPWRLHRSNLRTTDPEQPVKVSGRRSGSGPSGATARIGEDGAEAPGNYAPVPLAFSRMVRGLHNLFERGACRTYTPPISTTRGRRHARNND